MKKLFKTVLVLILAAFVVAGCSSNTSPNEEGGADDGADKTIVVGATAVPHAQILNEVVKDVLAADGWTLEVVEFTDYVMPNQTLEEGDLDANYFQTIAYMNEVNEENGWHLKEVQGVHYEAMTLFSLDAETIEDFKEGGKSIAVPNDGSNEDRALNLLAANGLIEYESNLSDPESGIVGNPYNIEIVPLAAEEIANHLEDVDGAIVNGNYALEAGLKDKANTVTSENFSDEEAAPYINYLVVKEGNENTEKTQALIKAITSEEVKNYIAETYGSAVVATFD